MGTREQQLVFGQILLTANRMQHRLDSMLPDLTLKQWLALIVMHNLPRPIDSVASVSAVMGTSHQNTTKLVTALQRAGFVELRPSPDDGRARQIVLTDAARSYFAEHEAMGERILDEMFDGVPPADVAACLRVLEMTQRNLERMAGRRETLEES